MATLYYKSGGMSTAVLAFELSSNSINEEVVCVLYVPTACQRRQKRRSLCYLADCDLLSVDLTKNNKITSLPHSSSQGKNQSTPLFTVKRLRWGKHFFFFLTNHIQLINVTVKETMSITLILLKMLCNMNTY